MVPNNNSNRRMCVKCLQLILINTKQFNFVHVDTHSTLSGTFILKLSMASERNFCITIWIIFGFLIRIPKFKVELLVPFSSLLYVPGTCIGSKAE